MSYLLSLRVNIVFGGEMCDSIARWNELYSCSYRVRNVVHDYGSNVFNVCQSQCKLRHRFSYSRRFQKLHYDQLEIPFF